MKVSNQQYLKAVTEVLRSYLEANVPVTFTSSTMAHQIQERKLVPHYTGVLASMGSSVLVALESLASAKALRRSSFNPTKSDRRQYMYSPISSKSLEAAYAKLKTEIRTPLKYKVEEQAQRIEELERQLSERS